MLLAQRKERGREKERQEKEGERGKMVCPVVGRREHCRKFSTRS